MSLTTCGICEGPLVNLGRLGRRLHLRCRDCGMDHRSVLDPDESLYPAADVYDDMDLCDLMRLAQSKGIPGFRDWTNWLEDHYDPAKSALIELLDEHDESVVR